MIRIFAITMIAVVLVGCSQSASELPQTSFDAVSAATFNPAGAPTVEFTVPDMMCEESCAVKVKEILAGSPGAKEVIVDFDTKTATVAIEEGKFDPQQAIAALVDHHFDQATLKDRAVSPAPTATINTEATPQAPAR